MRAYLYIALENSYNLCLDNNDMHLDNMIILKIFINYKNLIFVFDKIIYNIFKKNHFWLKLVAVITCKSLLRDTESLSL